MNHVMRAAPRAGCFREPIKSACACMMLVFTQALHIGGWPGWQCNVFGDEEEKKGVTGAYTSVL